MKKLLLLALLLLSSCAKEQTEEDLLNELIKACKDTENYESIHYSISQYSKLGSDESTVSSDTYRLSDDSYYLNIQHGNETMPSDSYIIIDEQNVSALLMGDQLVNDYPHVAADFYLPMAVDFLIPENIETITKKGNTTTVVIASAYTDSWIESTITSFEEMLESYPADQQVYIQLNMDLIESMENYNVTIEYEIKNGLLTYTKLTQNYDSLYPEGSTLSEEKINQHLEEEMHIHNINDDKKIEKEILEYYQDIKEN